MDNTQELIDKLTSAISFKFKNDGMMPNLTVSRLRHGYYCSVVRFPTGEKKKVICKAESDNLADALKEVTTAFLIFADSKPDPIQELAAVSKLMF